MNADPNNRAKAENPAFTEEVGSGETMVIPLVEETARIEKRAVETGRVRVSTHTDTVEQVLRDTLRVLGRA